MILPEKSLKLRFSVRALLVMMALLALFCWYHISWIHQRRQAITSGAMEGIAYTPRIAPGLLAIFGEPGYHIMDIDGELDSPHVLEARRLFPEAVLMVNSEKRFLPYMIPAANTQWSFE